MKKPKRLASNSKKSRYDEDEYSLKDKLFGTLRTKYQRGVAKDKKKRKKKGY